jgi:hypothetical protein
MFFLCVSGYTVANIFCRSNFKNGGTAILLKDGFVPINLPAAPSHLLSEKNFEYSMRFFNFGNLECVTICVYRSPLGDFCLFLQNLDILLDFVLNLYPQALLILSGDLNCNLLLSDNNQNSLLNLLRSYNLNVCNADATRVTHSSSSLLDITISNMDVHDTKSKVIVSDISDHYPVMTYFSVKTKPRYLKFMVRSYSDLSIAHFLNLLKTETWSDVYVDSHFDTKFSALYEKFLFYFNVAFPMILTKSTRKNINKQWITNEIRAFSVKLKDLFIRSKSSNCKDLELEYKSLKKSYRLLLNSSKRSYNNDRLLKCSNKSRETWKIINETKKLNVSPTYYYTDSLDILESEFNNYFTSLPSINQPTNNVNYGDVLMHSASSFFLSPCSENELKTIIDSCGNKFSAGIDEIPNFIIRLCFDLIKDPLLCLINASFVEGIFPSVLKTSNVIPLYKKKG